MMRAGRVVFLAAWLGAAGCALRSPSSAAPVPDAPELLLLNGKVFTGDPALPWAEAVAVRGAVIAATGTTEALRGTAGPGTRVIDLGGRLVIPGINDAHVHAPWGLRRRAALQLPPNATVEQVVAAIREAAAAQPEGTWLEGTLPLSWLETRAADRDALDPASQHHPVRLGLVGGHVALVNTAALREWGIPEDRQDPPGGALGRKDGRLDGWLFEHALWIPMRAAMAHVSDAEILAAIGEFDEEALSVGITSLQTMPLVPAARLAPLLEAAAPKVRWRLIDFRYTPFDASASTLPVKYVLDGTPLERGAALRAPYADAPATHGQLNYSAEEIAQMIDAAASGAHALLLHTVGDATIDAVLTAMEARPEVDWPARRVRLEHADLLPEDLLPRIRKLGVIIVQNPAHLSPGVKLPRFGEQRHGDVARVRSLLAAGIPFALGSDGPLNPFLNLMWTVSHPRPEEALTLEAALTAYTSGAAYAEFAEATKGRLSAGMAADLAVLTQDIFTVPLEALPGTRSVLTVVGGRIAHEVPLAPAPTPDYPATDAADPG